jgi:hypothetical protein
MDFYIKKGATLPSLTMEPVLNGYNQDFFFDFLQDSDILFYMDNIRGCLPKIVCGPCCLVEVENCNNCPTIPLIQYQWQEGDTDETGVYEGYFEIINKTTSKKLVVPIREKLRINIQD